MGIFNQVKEEINFNREQRLEGKDLCIPWLNFPRLGTALPGIQRGRNYMITSGTKGGKTQLADALFVMEPINYLATTDTDIEVDIQYFSMEMSKKEKVYQLISNRIYVEHGETISAENLQSLFQGYILEEKYQNIINSEQYQREFEYLESIINYIDWLRSPTSIYRYLFEIAAQNGKFYKNGIEVKFKIHPDTKYEKLSWDSYVPNNPRKFIICIFDHISLFVGDNDEDLHGLMGMFTSQYLLNLRDKFGFTSVVIQQQAVAGDKQQFTLRGGSIIEKLRPSHSTLGDNLTTSRDVDIIFGIFNPYKSNIPMYPEENGYDITRWKDNYRELSILLNRRGRGNLSLDLYFNGAVNFFSELEPPEAFEENPRLYEKYSLK